MKKFLEPLANAWQGVKTHKLRSSLTILGIVIGVAAVISLMSIGKGVTSEILSTIESMGSDLITISPGSSMGFGGVRSASGSSTTLTMEDAEAIADEVAYVAVAAPTSSSSAQLIYGSENTYAQITGTTPDYLDIGTLEFASGSFFTDYDNENSSKVAVIGADIADTLFTDTNTSPVGEQIRAGNVILRVIGVLESSDSFMSSSDNSVYIPLSTLQNSFSLSRTAQGGHIVSSISVIVSDSDQTENVIADITTLLRSRHELSAADDDDFSISSTEEIAETISQVSGTMTLFLGAIAGIALLVGGIGVMNIMLVSVVERTREIGIRKALGARERDIWSQFLIEAAFLSFSGGIIGVIAGFVTSYIINTTGLITTLVTADIVILALSVSIGIGLFFGFYPARQASRLNPIEALRSE